MQALHVTVAVEGSTAPPEHLARVVADVSSRPGFLHGYCLAPVDGTAETYAFFDTEEHARAHAPRIGDGRAGGRAEIIGVEVHAVAAHA